MRYSKILGHLETPKPRPRTTTGRWFDLLEFLELRDLDSDERPAPRPPKRPADPLGSSSGYVPHSLGHDLDPDEH